MILSGFPTYILVTLGPSWTGSLGLFPGMQIVLKQVSGSNIWTEDGTTTPDNATNRLYFVPLDYPFTAYYGGYYDQPYVQLKNAASGSWHLLGQRQAPRVSGEATYNFKDVWNAAVWFGYDWWGGGTSNGFLAYIPYGYTFYGGYLSYKPSVFSSMDSFSADAAVISSDKHYFSFPVTTTDTLTPASQTATIKNSGVATIDLGVAVSDSGWLTASLGTSTLAMGETTTLTVSIDATSLPKQQTKGTITLTDANDAAINSPFTINVEVLRDTRPAIELGQTKASIINGPDASNGDLYANDLCSGRTYEMCIKVLTDKKVTIIGRAEDGQHQWGININDPAKDAIKIYWREYSTFSNYLDARVASTGLSDGLWHHLVVEIDDGFGVTVTVDNTPLTVSYASSQNHIYCGTVYNVGTGPDDFLIIGGIQYYDSYNVYRSAMNVQLIQLQYFIVYTGNLGSTRIGVHYTDTNNYTLLESDISGETTPNFGYRLDEGSTGTLVDFTSSPGSEKNAATGTGTNTSSNSYSPAYVGSPTFGMAVPGMVGTETGGGPTVITMSAIAYADLEATGEISRVRSMGGSGLFTSQATATLIRLEAEGDGIYLETKLLKHIFDITLFSPSSLTYVAVCSRKPRDSDDGSSILEPTDSAYARVGIFSTDWLVDSSGNVKNLSAIQFPIATANWGPTPYLVLMDSPTGGQVLKFAHLPTTPSITTGTRLTLDADGTTRFAYADEAPLTNSMRRVLQGFVMNLIVTGRIGEMSLSLLTGAPAVDDDVFHMLEPITPFLRAGAGIGSNFWSFDSTLNAVKNTNPITIPGTSSDPGTLTHWAITTSLFGGQLMFFGQLDSSRSPGANTDIVVAAEEIVLRLRVQ